MADLNHAMPNASDSERLVIYEHPLHERVRTFLRLEFLFEQAGYHAARDSVWSSRAAISNLLDILAIISRGDIRSDVLKELEKHATVLGQYQFRQDVDTGRLNALLETIASLRQSLGAAGGQLAQELKDNEFLNAVKHRSGIPGGTCEFDLPDYNFWLNRSHDARMKDFKNWLSSLEPLNSAIRELLWLTRESAQPTQEKAVGGMFQKSLEKGVSCQLIRVTMLPGGDCFPEISGSQHRFTIRFLDWQNIGSRPAQVSDDIGFYLACC
ncbi:MAG: cell division protein ZapD [Gammaproteobacteria bacterium]|nr:cell division protein ZapD [Gammaproteobacteria bacterium]